jgi:hypothetical protein
MPANIPITPTVDQSQAGQLWGQSAADNITAFAGGGQGGAYQVVSEITRVTVVATAGDSIKLPPAVAGLDLMIINHGANAMQIFAQSGSTDTIDDIAGTTGVSQMPNSTVFYVCTLNGGAMVSGAAGKWYTEGLATGFDKFSGLQTLSFQDGITAHSGGGQASGFPITKMISRVSVVGAGGDSVTLPVSQPGMQLAIYNGTAATSMNVFPNAGGTGTEAINALGANAAFAIAGVTYNIFTCFTAGQWFTK